MQNTKIENMEERVEAANQAVERVLANKPDPYFTTMGIARMVAARHFTGKPRELADWEKAHQYWVEKKNCKGMPPAYPAGYTLVKGTMEEAAETGNWDLFDEQGFLYLYDTGYPRGTDGYSGPIPKEFVEKWGL